GEMMFLGAPRTYSYFQSGLDMRGRLAWGDHEETVAGTVGWIDRQWAPEDFTVHQDWRASRYRNEWRVIQLDHRWDMSCFHQYQRDAHNAVVPWTGLSAQGPAPAFELRATPHVDLIIPDFIRSPGTVRGRSMLTEGPRWFPHRYRLRAPEWNLDLRAEPLVDAPDHALPSEYWTGLGRIEGRLGDRSVSGWGGGLGGRRRRGAGGDERARALSLPLEHAPSLEEDRRAQLAYRCREVEALALRGDPAAAAEHARRHIEPWMRLLDTKAQALA